MSIIWDAQKAIWRDDATDAALGAMTIITARDVLADDYERKFADLALLLTAGSITVDDWAELFILLILESVSAGYIFGRGGIDLMESADWVQVARNFNYQKAYADKFIVEVRELLTVRGEGETIQDIMQYHSRSIEARARLYAGGVIEGFEKAQVQRESDSRGALTLPVYPTQESECQSRCRCYWSLIADDEARVWRCRWVTREDSGVCPTCIRRGRIYRDLVIGYDVRDIAWLDEAFIADQPIIPE